MTADHDLLVYYSAKEDPEAVAILDKYNSPENYVSVLQTYHYKSDDVFRAMAEYRELSGKETIQALEHMPFQMGDTSDEKLVRLSDVEKLIKTKFGSLEK